MLSPERTNPIASNGACFSTRTFGMKADTKQADWSIDQEDPVPRGISGDEAPEWRAADRTNQRRHCDQRHRAEQEMLVDAAYQDEAADRRHHCPADALCDTGENELLKRMRSSAADRAENEYADRDAEN